MAGCGSFLLAEAASGGTACDGLDAFAGDVVEKRTNRLHRRINAAVVRSEIECVIVLLLLLC